MKEKKTTTTTPKKEKKRERKKEEDLHPLTNTLRNLSWYYAELFTSQSAVIRSAVKSTRSLSSHIHPLLSQHETRGYEQRGIFALLTPFVGPMENVNICYSIYLFLFHPLIERWSSRACAEDYGGCPFDSILVLNREYETLALTLGLNMR